MTHAAPHPTLILGDEYDDALRERLMAVLRQLGAQAQGPTQAGMAGSQELLTLDLLVQGQPLRVESETYVGLSISGPADLLERVRALVEQAARGA